MCWIVVLNEIVLISGLIKALKVNVSLLITSLKSPLGSNLGIKALVFLHESVNLVDFGLEELALLILQFSLVDVLDVLTVLHQFFLHCAGLCLFEVVLLHLNLDGCFSEFSLQLGNLFVLAVQLLLDDCWAGVPSL